MVLNTIKKAGNVNAAHKAYIKDINGKTVGTCMDTPNNAAFAFIRNDAAITIHTPFNGIWTRESLKSHFYGLDSEYHSKFINFL